MTRFQFELATPDDDEGLRAVLCETTMPGRIGLQFLREPNFFEGNCVLGSFQQTIVCRDQFSGEIIGFGCRSVREMMVHGQPRPVGYLSMLRAKQKFRSLGLLSRGYRFFRELDLDDPADFYLTTIADDNQLAISLLTSGRAGLPRYDYEGSFGTFVIPTRQRFKPLANRVFEIRTATESDFDTVVQFLDRQSNSRRYFPRYQRSDFGPAGQTFRNILPQNILLAFDARDEIRGTMAFWDQRPFRQTVVSGYQGILSWLRPVYNAWAHVGRQIALPKPGQPFHYGFVAIPLVVNSDAQLFQNMLGQLLEQARREQLDCLLFGCHQSDPLWKTANQISARRYDTRLYRVGWDVNGNSFPTDHLNEIENPYLELGCL